MKLYFHINFGESQNNGKITAVVDRNSDIDEDLQILDVVKAICKQILEKERIKIEPQHFQVYNGKTALSHETKLSKLDGTFDLKVTVKESVCDTTTRYERTVINKASEDPKPAATTTTTIKSAAVKRENETAEVKAILKKANSSLAKKRHDLVVRAYSEALKMSPNNYEALFGMAYVYYKARRYEDAIPFFETLVSKDSNSFVVLMDYGRALTLSGNEEKAVGVLSRCINDLKRANQSTKMVHDANVALGMALEAAGELQSAFQLFLSISQMTEKQHVDALLGYARVGHKLGHVTLDDVFIVALNAVAIRKDEAHVQQFFAEMVMEKGGLDALEKQMHTAWSDVQSLVFIASFLREFGALRECMHLIGRAFSLASKSVDVALLKVHIHENLCDLDGMLAFAADFFEGKLDRQVVRKVDLSVVSKVIRLLLKSSVSDDAQHDEFTSFVALQLNSVKDMKEPSPKGNMLEIELQLLALYFTVVKTFYVKGILKPIPLFLDVLDPLFRMNDNLHKTLIRNEQAYYSCISQLFKAAPPPEECMPSGQRIYVIGDSHVLPIAWKTLKLEDTEVVIEPELLTGLKIWHLRKESKFYTKLQYEKAIQRIPNGSTCIFILGEIDCREGISSGVEKAIYDSLEDSVNAVVDIYVNTLVKLQQRKKLKIFVHPVPPVLKETRNVVEKFNYCLKERVTKCAKLSYLDFVDELVDRENNDGCFLKKEFQLDGTHLHPSYIALLEKSISK